MRPPRDDRSIEKRSHPFLSTYTYAFRIFQIERDPDLNYHWLIFGFKLSNPRSNIARS